jgi:hypothetical protein
MNRIRADKLTAPQLKALTILSTTDYAHPIAPRGFAEKMWKGTDTTIGRRFHMGRAASMSGGSYLGKLVQKGWVRWVHDPDGYCITEKGKEILKNNTP